MRQFAQLIFCVASSFLAAMPLLADSIVVKQTASNLAAANITAASKLNANDFHTIIEPYGQIFPAFELASLSLAHKAGASSTPNTFGSEDSLIGASIVASKANQALTLTISAPRTLTTQMPRLG